MIKASEAKEQSKNNINYNTEQELRDAEIYITEAIQKGQNYCWCYTNLHEQALNKLIELGYKVRNRSNQKDGVMFSIRWDQ
jgi:predicted kinase